MFSKMISIKILWLIVFSSLILGCNSISEDEENSLDSKQASDNDECPEQPGKLNSNKVEQINLDDKGTTVSDKFTFFSEALGYTFRGEEGQKFMYSTEEELCMWVYTPDNELLEGLELPTDGSYTVQISVPQGTKTFELEMVLREPSFSSSTSTGNDRGNNYDPSTLEIDSDSSIDSEKAVEIVQKWQQAKRRIFAPPYDKTLVSELLTDNAYAKKVSPLDGSESPIDWLQNNQAHYTYRFQSVEEVANFQSFGNSAFIDVVVKEERSLCVKGKVNQKHTVADQLLIRYDLKYVDGKWKISEQDTRNIINRRDNSNSSCRIIY